MAYITLGRTGMFHFSPYGCSGRQGLMDDAGYDFEECDHDCANCRNDLCGDRYESEADEDGK